MININEIREEFRIRILESGLFSSSDIAWENIKFNPANKLLWLQENYLPIAEGRVTSLGDDLEGIFQYTINIPINDIAGDTVAVETGVALGSLFASSEVITTTNYKTSIAFTKCSFQGELNDSVGSRALWYSYIVDIQFRSFEK
jgi:hypothetical protein